MESFLKLALLFLVIYICVSCFVYDVNVWASVLTGVKANPMPLWAAILGGIVFSKAAVPVAVLTWILVTIGVVHPIL